MEDGTRAGDGAVGSDRSPRLLARVRGRGEPLDWAVLLAVPLASIAVLTLPPSIRFEYALAYQQPTLTTMFTAHFVHLSPGHLETNLLAYAVLVPFAYLYSLLAGRRTEFYLVFGTSVLLFPVVLSGVDLVFVRPRIGLGASGIVTAVLGFLPVTLFWFLHTYVDRRIEAGHAPVLFFLGTALVAVRAVPPSAGSALAGVLSVLGGALYLRRLSTDLGRRGAIDGSTPSDAHLAFAVLGLTAFVAVVLAAFPADHGGDGPVVNLLVHYLGYCFGFIVPYTTFRLWGGRR